MAELRHRGSTAAARADTVESAEPPKAGESKANQRTSRMRDVADYAGVALSTVSAFINDSAPVGRASAQRIREAIDALGFSPNAAARSLARGKVDPEQIFVVIRTDGNGSTLAEAYRSETDAQAASARRRGQRIVVIRTTLN